MRGIDSPTVAAAGARLQTLSELLDRYRPLWQERSFHRLQPEWGRQWPELLAALDALPLATAEALQQRPGAAARWLQPWLAEAATLHSLCRLPATAGMRPLAERLARDMPGRKRRQVEAFAGALEDRGRPLLEWCAGKGHLSRGLSAGLGRRSVIGLEQQQELVDEGNRLAHRDGLPVQLHRCDVLGEEAARWLEPARQVVALHACGDLHRRLLVLGSAHEVAALAWSPCCYHRTTQSRYRPLSRAAARVDLGLSRDALRTAVQETVTAGRGQRQRRRRLQQWRLGFDLLQRELRGVDDYLPVPSLPARLADTSFRHFCQHVAALNSLPLPPGIDWEQYRRGGERRFAQVTARDLVRMLFRRPLELWLLLDQQLFMAEQGYATTMASFCSRSLTPRNVLLQAWRPGPGESL